MLRYKMLRHEVFPFLIESKQNEIYHEIHIFNLDSTMANVNSTLEASNNFGPVWNFNEGIGKVVSNESLFIFFK